MKNTKIAIYTSFYNCSKYIDQIFENVLSINYDNWNWFVTDDFSTDDTGTILREKCKNNSRIIYIIRPSATKDIFKLGRGHESDLRINDISVSRCHAKIKLENGKFMLEDN